MRELARGSAFPVALPPPRSEPRRLTLEELSIGDWVQLATGGPPMRVVDMLLDAKLAVCSWGEDGREQAELLPADMLVRPDWATL